MVIPIERSVLVAMGTVVLLTATGCAGDTALPAAPAPTLGSSLVGLLASGGEPGSPFGTNALELVEMLVSTPAGGSGRVNVIPTGVPDFNNFEITVNVHGAPADTDLFFQIRGDIGSPILPPGQQADGICQHAAAWPAPPVSLGVIDTSGGGAGVLHLALETTNPFFNPGVTTDFMYRVVDFGQAFELRTACAQFTGK